MLTLVGLHGILAYLVAQRQREIGIRMAMGATPRDVRQMVLVQGIALVAIGIPLGLVASLFTSRLASTLLVDIQKTDPLLHALIAALLTVVSLVAMLIPANRAAGSSRSSPYAPTDLHRRGARRRSIPLFSRAPVMVDSVKQ